MALSPNWIGAFLGGDESPPVSAGQELLRVEIEGMHREACTVTVSMELSEVDGVAGV